MKNGKRNFFRLYKIWQILKLFSRQLIWWHIPNFWLVYLEYAKQSTASSIIMKFSCAWYFKSFLILPVVKFQTSIKPSTDPVTKYCPSGENAEHSIWDLAPNLICLLISVGYFSSSCSRIAALPRNKSIWVPEKRKKNF